MSENSMPGYVWGRPSLFEVLFAIMADYFARAGIEWAAVETGLGGRYDATNTLQSDVAVVTNISLEHTQVLGTTVRAIAAEKAAIIKPGAHAVTAARDPEALDVIRARCEEVGAPLLEVGADVHARVLAEDVYGQKLELSGPGQRLTVSLPLAGAFQADNAATAFAAALSLGQRSVDVPAAAIEQGLERVRVPGRFEIEGQDPLIILDGAHNPAGAERLAEDIARLLPARKVVLVVAAMRDKDLNRMAGALGPLSSFTIITRAPGTERAASGPELAEAFTRWTERTVTELNTDRAMERARQEAGTHGVIVVTGSLYLVGHIRAQLARPANVP
jgi:dihydrofolate synthase/folylpolyglutamate synthase